jgi:hypothetical protein
VSAGNLREELHDPKNNLCQKPVGIIENYGQPRQECVARSERRAIARIKKAIGTTSKFANNEIGVTI